MATSRLLLRFGYLVTVANSVAEAAGLCRDQTFDLLLSDIHLPDGDGYRLMEDIAKPHNLPAIAVTGSAFPEDRKHCLEAGFKEHISKPYLLEDLLSAIRRARRANRDCPFDRTCP